MQCPPPLSIGDRISVVAPSGPFEEALLREGLARLNRFNVTVPGSLWGRRDGFFAGTDDLRLREFQEALDDPDVKAILVARGGYGLSRILPRLDLRELYAHPKWIIGFSDVTTIHAYLSQRGIVSLHAPNGTTLARSSQAEVDELHQLLAGATTQSFFALESVVGGSAEGPLFGGNLTVLFAEAASGRLSVPPGSILLLEDVTETSYRIDRMLTALSAGGHLSQIAGILLGDFVDCSAGKFEVPVSDVLFERLSTLGVPVVANFPAGHGVRNRPLLLGARARISDAPSEVQLTVSA